MLTGRNPLDGEPLLGQSGVPARGAVPGFDLTFSAPKSVSLLWALGDRETFAAIIAAHERSLEAALDYMQREARWTRRGAGGKEFVPGNGFLAAAFRHRSSRNGDPQLHSHVLIANATKGPDGRWTRLYHPAIYTHAKTASYLYESQLHHELTRALGVEWQPVRKGIAEIDGFADRHLREFSTRRAEILKAAGGADASARARQVANLVTRASKEENALSTATLRQRWAERAGQLGLDWERIEATLHREHSPGRPVLTVEQLDRAVTASASHFDRREAIQAVADSLPAGAPAQEVERLADAFLASETVIPIGQNAKGERFTTRRIWELEREALAAAERLRSEGSVAASEQIAERVLAGRPTLKADQSQMVRRLLTDSEGVAVVIGEAGTGKTHATVAAGEGWAAAGIPVRAAAPTWRAANVLRAEGLQATSIASLLGELDRAETRGALGLEPGSVLLVDETGMVDSATLARLIHHAEAAQAKLVLIGDPAQLGEIEAGGLFATIAERSEPVHLDEVIRHNFEVDREAAKRIREGEGGEALDLYRSEERVVVAPDAEARREAMVADWWQSFSEGEDALMVAKRKTEVARLNETARELMRAEGRLGAEEIEVGGACFAAGDQVITRVNDHRAEIYNRERWQVAEVDARAQTVVLDGIDTQRRVCVDAAFLERVNPRDGAPTLQHGYAATTYQAQGSTVDRAYVMADPSMDRQELYVAASRSRDETYIYAVPEVQVDREEIAPRSPYLREGLDHIAEAAGRDRAQTSAHSEALGSELGQLPTAELVARREGLARELEHQSRLRQHQHELGEKIELAERRLENATAHRDAVEAGGRRERRRELLAATQREKNCREALSDLLAESRRIEPANLAPRREAAVIDHLLAARRELAVTAARIAPPQYIRAELGERPADPAKRHSWERGVDAIERHRQEHGISDRRHAFGAPSRDAHERAHQEETRLRLLRQVQRDLGREVASTRGRDMGRGMGIG
jgi:conjugative relaxase-like TrwC/TraI family protein